VFDLDAYLERIGLNGRTSLAEVHRAHATSIPFENLSPHQGIPASLAGEDLQGKLVAARRGGYCFEQNMLLALALRELGADVDLLLARVRVGAAPAAARPRGHLILRVHEAARAWHADVGFGLGTLLEPIPFGPGKEHEQSGWRFRVVQDGPELVLQGVADGEWIDLYGFPPEPVPQIDVEAMNWWTSTHPRSPFVTGVIVAAQSAEGMRISLSDWGELELIESTPEATTRTAVAREEIPGILQERFALGGFALGADGRLVSRS
jgi:N-hydroxyarylamine O-acetyltransferase